MSKVYCDDWSCPARVSCAHHFGRSEAYAAMRENSKVESVARSGIYKRDDGYGFEESRREGFPHSSPPDFVQFFCAGHKGCTPDSIVTRIEFVKIPPSSLSEDERNG